MTTDENKAIYNRYIQEGFNEGKLDCLAELLAPDYVYHDAPPGTPAGAEGIRQVITMFRAGFPDLKITIEEQIAEGDTVCSRTTMYGTHKGMIFGLAPTGNAVAMKGMTWVHVVGGRITESWVRNDVGGLMQQLGAGL